MTGFFAYGVQVRGRQRHPNLGDNPTLNDKHQVARRAGVLSATAPFGYIGVASHNSARNLSVLLCQKDDNA